MRTEFIFSEKWCDIIFEKRNHAYGAYVLRKRQPDNLIIGWVTTFLAFAFLFSGFVYLNNRAMKKIKATVFPKTDTSVIVFDDQPKTNIQPPAKISPPKLTVKSTGLFVAADSSEKDVDTATASTVILSFNGNPEKGHSDSLAVDDSGGGNTGGSSKKIEPTPIAAVMPQFPGGEIAMVNFLRRTVTFPDEYLRRGISSIVYVQFVIDVDGRVTEIKSLNGKKDYPLFEESAIEAVSKMPLWKPGEQGGMKVPVLYTLPVNFSVK